MPWRSEGQTDGGTRLQRLFLCKSKSVLDPENSRQNQRMEKSDESFMSFQKCQR